jgi:hypothetical protein
MRGNYSHNHLLAAQERVTDELARTQGNGRVGVSHLRDLLMPEIRLGGCKFDGEGREVRAVGLFCGVLPLALQWNASKSGPEP